MIVAKTTPNSEGGRSVGRRIEKAPFIGAFWYFWREGKSNHALKPAWILDSDDSKLLHTVNHTVKNLSHTSVDFPDQRWQGVPRIADHFILCCWLLTTDRRWLTAG